MSERQPATDKGTADRIEADDGGYWVRLVTKQALRREGVCMGNCLDSQGYGQDLAGEEEMVSDALWSLRRVDGVSYMLVEIAVSLDRTARVDAAKGPMNSNPSGLSIRQLRHLVAAFRAAGATLTVPEHIALTGEDGRTWRPDRAPREVRDAVEARLKAEGPSLPPARVTGLGYVALPQGNQTLVVPYRVASPAIGHAYAFALEEVSVPGALAISTSGLLRTGEEFGGLMPGTVVTAVVVATSDVGEPVRREVEIRAVRRDTDAWGADHPWTPRQIEEAEAAFKRGVPAGPWRPGLLDIYRQRVRYEERLRQSRRARRASERGPGPGDGVP